MRREVVRHKPEDAPLNEPAQCSADRRMVPLSSVSEIRVSNVDKKSESGERAVRLCNYTDVYKYDYITKDMDFMRATAGRSEIARFGIAIGDVVITKDSETPDDIGIPALVDSTVADLVCGYHLAIIRPAPSSIDPAFLAKQLSQPRIARYYAQQANGSTRYGLSIIAIERTPIWMPPINQQKKIGEIARLLDAAIDKMTSMIAKLKQVRIGLAHDLLTRGIDDNGELRDPVRDPKRFQNSPVGHVPQDWDTIALNKLCLHIGSGVTPRGGQDVYTATGILFIRSQNVTFDGLKLEDVAFIPADIHLGMLRSEVHPHDVLFNITGASIGRCCAMPAGLGTANVNQHVCILRVPDPRDSDAIFLAAVLASVIGQKQLYALNTNGNRQGLNYQQLGSFTVPWPPPEERKAITKRLGRLSSQIEKEIAEREKLEALKCGLISDLLAGRAETPECVEMEATS